MKSLSACLLLLVLMIAPSQDATAQLLPEQRIHDFQNLVALYAKRYAPYDWKRQALGFDLFDVKPWLERVQAAKDDLEFFEIEAEYVGKLQDTHTGFTMTSSFRANLGLTVDIYEGKVLIDGINRTMLPLASYPFQIGDELVSVDGISSDEWINRISVWSQWGNPVSTRRRAAAQITLRVQSNFPRAVDVGDSAAVQVRRASGAVENYTIPWAKTGYPVTTVGPVPFPRATAQPRESSASDPSSLEGLAQLHNYRLPDNDVILTSVPWTDESGIARTYVTGIGSPAPVFRAGFPSNFVQRLNGVSPAFQYSGTYAVDGLTLGYLRIPNFSPANSATALAELRTEIDYLQRNTDGLIVDVTRNPGGGCYMLDAAATLIPYPFYFFGEQLRPTQGLLNSFQSLLENAVAVRAEQWIIDTYQVYRDAVEAALTANRGMTDPIAACNQLSSGRPALMNDNAPAPAPYRKPVIVLIDEFSISAADIFPSMIQDNRRALLVGTRTAGGGGSVSGWPSGLYSESVATNTNSLVVRKRPIVTDDYPTAPYVENIGARPDIPLDYMTRENLLNGGRTFVNQFTQILLDQIRKAPAPTPFALSNNGVVSWTTAGASGPAVAGYGRIQPDSGNTAPNGFALISLRTGSGSANTLVSEAAVAASAPFQLGRFYAEIDGPVNTGLAIANPNSLPATVFFYFAGPNGTSGYNSTVVPANGQIAAFLDQAPFNATKPLVGTFTFSSTAPVVAVALRSFTNERGEPLLTTIPVAQLSATAGANTVIFPDYADGSGWTTQIALINPTDAVLTGTLEFFDSAGNSATLTIEGQTNSSFNYSIPARAAQRLRTSGSSPSTKVGSVHAVPATGTASPTGLVVLSFKQGNFTVAQTGVLGAAGGSALRLYVEASGDFARKLVGSVQSGLAISNPSDTDLTISLELNRLDGSSTGLTGTLQVPANGQVARFVDEIPGLESMPLPFEGLLRISSALPVSVMGLRARYNERRDFLITSTPPVDETADPANGELFFPHFAEGGGYTTKFVLFNGSAGQQSAGVLRLVSQSGGALNLPLH